MRTLVVHNLVSLDGFSAGPEGDFMALPFDPGSTRRAPEDTEPWRETTRIVRRAEAHERIAELKEGDDGEILMFGSRTLWNDLLDAGLVDEVHLMVGSVVLGDGVPAFAAKPDSSLRLLAAPRTWEDSDNVLLRYGVSRLR